MKKVFSFDAETDGLWGQPFAIAATVTAFDGTEIAVFAARLNDTVVSNEWVKANVLPHIQDMRIVTDEHRIPRDVARTEDEYRAGIVPAYDALLGEFARFYMKHKTDAVIIAHCPCPVEAHLMRECHRLGLIGDWDGPFPLVGVEGLLDAAGEPMTEATAYATKHGLQLPEGSAHNPLFDCRLATAMYRHLKGW